MAHPTERVDCYICKKNKAPLKLANMFVDKFYEVRVVCSECIVKTPPSKLFPKDGPIPWPERFLRSVSPPNHSSLDFVGVLTLALIVGILLWLMLGKGAPL